MATTPSSDSSQTPSISADPASIQNSTDVFANGLIQLLKPIVIDCDTRIQAVFTSQSQLSDQIDELAAELERFVSLSQSPAPQLIGPVQTLIRSKQRLAGINSTLLAIRERLDRCEKIASSDSGSTSSFPDVFSNIFGKMKSPSTAGRGSAPPTPTTPQSKTSTSTPTTPMTSSGQQQQEAPIATVSVNALPAADPTEAADALPAQ
eukprot:TRINITY_DN6966_c0_g2_i1.p1 TRINITY_DN6966_c0_g2~~TRINITY_DN6966_c0_g2_i1.p1  ORF type:complete len:206 (-),score=11.02 TRINITY_DN6966_c0_g2_i1:52-669(-)